MWEFGFLQTLANISALLRVRSITLALSCIFLLANDIEQVLVGFCELSVHIWPVVLLGYLSFYYRVLIYTFWIQILWRLSLSIYLPIYICLSPIVFSILSVDVLKMFLLFNLFYWCFLHSVFWRVKLLNFDDVLVTHTFFFHGSCILCLIWEIFAFTPRRQRSFCCGFFQKFGNTALYTS